MQDLHIQKARKNIAWIFPGQSSQKLGMGLELLAYPFARAKFQQAEKILGWSVLEICQNPEKLSSTIYTQPCLYVIETLLAELMKRKGYQPNLVAGYSLGEYAAIYSAGGFDFETGLCLVKRRGELMNRSPKGNMVALIGFNQEQLEQQISQTPNVWLMNDDLNLAIISGTSEAVKFLVERVKAKRAIPLNVNCAFHTPLMLDTATKFQEILESVRFEPLKVPVVSSTELVPTFDVASLKNSLIKQIYQPVKWRAISLLMAKQGIIEVVEVGTGNDLINQMRRTCPELTFTNANNLITIKQKQYPFKIRPQHLHFA